MESQPQNPEFRKNSENFRPWISGKQNSTPSKNFLDNFSCKILINKMLVCLSNRER